MAPVSPFPAFKLGEKVDDPLAMYLSTSTRSREPRGDSLHERSLRQDGEGLPVGMQILTNHFRRSPGMFRLAAAFERGQGRVYRLAAESVRAVPFI